MSDRQMFVIEGSTSTPAEALSLSDLHLREVSDLQEWVIAHPEILGPDVKIVTVEFNLWESEGGNIAHQRLDVLGLDNSGRLVVAELKRESDVGIHVQAITYAALVSGFTEETLADAHAAFLTKRGETTAPDEALERLSEDLEAGFDPDVLSNPRIVLIAREFPAQVITTAEWLSNRSIDITLIEVQAWRVGEQVAVTFDQVYPVAGVGDALLIPARRRVAQSQKTVAETTRAASATKVILEKDLLDNGTLLTWQPTTTIGPELRHAAATWVAENPARGQAVWRTEGGKPLEWLVDGKRYSPSGLVGRILKESAGVQPAVQGTKWWMTEDGVDLATLAYGTTLRDWSDLHRLIATIRPGEWTTYGDIGRAIGLPPQPVGTHIAGCADCPYGAHRVLTFNGLTSESFRWSDPAEIRTCREVLESEGLTFDPTGHADPATRLDADMLTARLSGPD